MPYRRETNVEYIIDTCTRLHILVFYGYNNEGLTNQTYKLFERILP